VILGLQILTSKDDPETFDKMPVGLQLVGRRFDDEKIVAILTLLEKVGTI
jgi:Asp-tRNA(Asn)/Glu-tRNA(Gln) amidotransferase A subunit family amidase